VRSALGDAGTIIVNVLSVAQHEGRGGVTYGRPGRIPGSVAVPARAVTDPVPTRTCRATASAQCSLGPGSFGPTPPAAGAA